MPPVGFPNFWLFYKLLTQTGTRWLIPPLPLFYLNILPLKGIEQESRWVYISFVLSFNEANSVGSCPAEKGKEQITHITLLSYMIPKIFRFFKMLGGLLPTPPLKISKYQKLVIYSEKVIYVIIPCLVNFIQRCDVIPEKILLCSQKSVCNPPCM